MVSGFLTSPCDHARMSSAVARPIRNSSKKLTSSTWLRPFLFSTAICFRRHAPRGAAGGLPVRGARRPGGSVHQVVDRGRLVPRQVDAQVGGGPLEVVVVRVAHLDGDTV